MPVNLSFASGNPVCIEDHNDVDTGISGVIGQDLQKAVSGGFDICLCQLLQLLPGENNVIAIHQKEFLNFLTNSLFRGSCGSPASGSFPVFLCRFRRNPLHRFFVSRFLRREHGSSPHIVRMTQLLFDRPVGFLKDSLQLILLRAKSLLPFSEIPALFPMCGVILLLRSILGAIQLDFLCVGARKGVIIIRTIRCL